MIFKCQRHFENYPQGDHDTKNVVNIQDEKSNNYLFGNVHCTFYTRSTVYVLSKHITHLPIVLFNTASVWHV